MRFFFIVGIFALLTSCQSSSKPSPALSNEIPEMRHGWTFLTGPKPTKVYQSNLDSIQRGEKLFSKHCARCHGLDGKGDGKDAEIWQIYPSNLTELPDTHSKPYLIFQINKGKAGMPRWQNLLSDQELVDLSSYIRHLSRQKK